MLKPFLARTHPLRRRLQREPYYRFQSFEELRLAASWDIRIEANTASIDDWLRLPGISIHQARRLTQLTESGLFFNCIEDVAAALSLPAQQIQAWSVVLQFCYYEPQHSLEPVAINVNTATASELSTVPAIDAFLGRAIIHYRQAAPYRDLADLQQRLRLNVQTTSELLHYLKF
jgi:DNA uptake protein ComE-like DNA-binding protein